MTQALTPGDVAASTGVSRETLAKYDRYLLSLARWNETINLVGHSTLADPWRRHILDSLQLHVHLPRAAKTVVDLGSGAGFPGLVLAAVTEHEVHLIESDKRKAAFLRQTVAAMQLANVKVHAVRVEELQLPADVIMARAFAPIKRLLDLSRHIATLETRFLLLKGRNVDIELTEAAVHWTMKVMKIASLADSEGAIVRLDGVAAKNA